MSHCAAGVRWLKYLHQQAAAAAAVKEPPERSSQAPGSSQEQQDVCSANLQSQLSNCSLNGKHNYTDEEQQQHGAEQPGTCGCVEAAASAETTAAAAVTVSIGTRATAGGGEGEAAAALGPGNLTQEQQENSAPQWMQEAQQHESVEAWFHNLIRQNFMGALKVKLVPLNESCVSCDSC